MLLNQKELSSSEDSKILDDKSNLYQQKNLNILLMTKYLKEKNIQVTTNLNKPKSDTAFFKDGIFDFNTSEFVSRNTKFFFIMSFLIKREHQRKIYLKKKN